MDQNNGGPAFPHVPESFVYMPGQGRANIPGTEGGMTLRDYFAAKAMQGWSANPIPQDSSIQEVAEWAYRQADAMLAARGKS